MKKWFDEKFVPVMGKLGNMRYLAAIRDGFALITPLIIIGAIAVFFRTAIFGAAGAAETSLFGIIARLTGDLVEGVNPDGAKIWEFSSGLINDISSFGNWTFYAIEQATMGMIAVLVAISLGYVVARSREGDTFMGALIGFSSFMIANSVGHFGWFGQATYYDATGLFAAIIVSIAATEFYCFLAKSEKLKIKMPDQVPPSVGRAFSNLIPLAIVLTTVGILNGLAGTGWQAIYGEDWTGPLSIADWIFEIINSPMKRLFGDPNVSFIIAIVYIFLVQFLWFFGLHGANILNGIFGPIYIALLLENVEFLNDGTLGANGHIFTQGTFDAYIFMGGAGVTIALLIATFIFSTRKDAREMARLGIAPGAFNINEPVMFGYPVVLNPMMVIPFILAPLALTFTTWIGLSTFVTKTTVWIPWTTPPIIGGLLASTNITGMILAAVNLGIAVAIYTPFVIASNFQGGGTSKQDAPKPAGKKLSVAKKAPAKKAPAKKTATKAKKK